MVPSGFGKKGVIVGGKFFRSGERKFCLKGVTYGPFSPDAGGGTYASREQTTQDLAQIRELGANLVRVYHVPPRWFLDLAEEQGIKVLIDIPWEEHLFFLDSAWLKSWAREAVREAVRACTWHTAVIACSGG